MRIPKFAWVTLVFVFATPVFAQVYIWTGELPTGWQGQLTPPNNGSSDLYFTDSLDPRVTLSASLDDVNSITLANGNNIRFSSASATTLKIDAIVSADENAGTLDFGSSIDIGISGSTAFGTGNNFILVRGNVTGSGPLVITGGSTGGGAVIYSNTGAGNTYTGSTLIGDGTNLVTVAFWNSSPFGAGGTVTLANGGVLIGHGTQTVSNPLVFNSIGSTIPIGLKSWDAPLTFSGGVTLDNSVVLNARPSQAFYPAPQGTGSVPVPGVLARNPIIFSGNIGESGGPRAITVEGQGILMLTGASNTYTGGTTVGMPGAYGSIVFGAGSIPSTGSILVNQGSYAGSADPATTAFATLLSHVAPTSAGSFGIDTLPGNATANFSGTIDLSTLTNPNVDIGTATSAILSGTLIPQSNTALRFGGGGGTLYVNTPISNAVSPTVLLNNFGSPNPLTVYLQGANTYTGTTTADDGFLIFDGASSMPAGTQLKAFGGATTVGASYIGYSDNVIGMTPVTFLSAFNKAATWGIVGFDSSNLAAPAIISGVDLTGFNDGTFIGTTTAAILTGTLVASTVTNGNQSANTLRFTAAKNGVLTVDSVIGSTTSVVVGSPDPHALYSSGTVIMNAPNTYTGGTTLNGGHFEGLTLGIGTNSALGTGPLTITNGGGGGLTAIEATAGGINLPNNIVIQNTAMAGATQLNLTGTKDFTLSGNISGDSTSSIALYNTTPINVTLSGDNSGYGGTFVVYNGSVKLPTNTSAGSGLATLDLEGSAGIFDFTGATAPIIEKLHGAVGSLVLGSGTVLTIDSTNVGSSGDSAFGGVISGGGSLVITNTSTTNDKAILLYGNNTYSGGTALTQNGLLVMVSNQGVGTGPVTVATSSKGAFGLDSGVTFTNPLIFTSGNLGGYGTFNPSGLGLAGTVAIGANQGVVPGLPVSNNKVVTGTLSFAGNMAFNNGGSFYWTLQDNARPDGASQLDIAGNLTINATAGAFGINLLSYDASGASNNAANFNVFAPYSWVIATTSGTIQNFNAADFTLGVAGFENGAIPATNFSLSVNGANNQLILNFSPVPEPSTYALLAAGLGIAALAGLRRRRAWRG